MLRGVMSVLGLEYLKKMVLAGLQLSGMRRRGLLTVPFGLLGPCAVLRNPWCAALTDLGLGVRPGLHTVCSGEKIVVSKAQLGQSVGVGGG